ncbi:hypothetical protein PTKIN_Ptkin11bG0185900 [Pterospermum kingtungense]
MNHHFTQLDDGVSAGLETAPALSTVVATVALALLMHVLWRCCCSCHRNHVKKYLSSSSSAADMDPWRITSVEKILKYKFKDKSLLAEALTHSSWDNNMSYERLEFLGDAALGLTVATHFFSLNPKLSPHQLTKLRKDSVSNEKLADVAAKHGLYRFVRSRNTLPFDPKVIKKYEEAVKQGVTAIPQGIWAEIVESLAGAVYLDVNFDLTDLSKVFKGLLMVDEIKLPEDEDDGSSEITGAQDELYGLCGKRKWPKPSYSPVKAVGCPDEMKYIYSVEIETDNGGLRVEGYEKSTVNDAKNSAAYLLLRTLHETSNMM